MVINGLSVQDMTWLLSVVAWLLFQTWIELKWPIEHFRIEGALFYSPTTSTL